jgi:Mn2+/Fe2+ NRAMP family transporter
MSDPSNSEPDSYALRPEDVQEPPTRLLDALRQVGPGLILAASIVGTGELINTTGMGAQQGYTLLWLIVLSCVIKVFVQIELGRYAISHGKTTLAALDTLPGPRLGTSWLSWLWLFMMLTTQAQIAAMEGLVGQAADMAFPGFMPRLGRLVANVSPAFGGYLADHPDYFWASLTCFAAILLLISGGYRRLERVTTLLVAMVTLLTVACVACLPWTPYPIDMHKLLKGFSFETPTSGIALAFSTFGITGVGASELFAYPYWCIEKGYARYAGARSADDSWARRARGWMWVMQVDAWFSTIVFTTATIAFYIMGAAVLHPQGLHPEGVGMIKTLAQMYVKPIGAWTKIVFLIGAWAVLFKTLYVATAGNARLTADFLDLAKIRKQPTTVEREREIRRWLILYPLLSLALYFLFREPKRLIIAGGYAQAIMIPLIAGATLYLRYRDRDPRVEPSKLTDVLAWVAFVIITLVAGFSLISAFR